MVQLVVNHGQRFVECRLSVKVASVVQDTERYQREKQRESTPLKIQGAVRQSGCIRELLAKLTIAYTCQGAGMECVSSRESVRSESRGRASDLACMRPLIRAYIVMSSILRALFENNCISMSNLCRSGQEHSPSRDDLARGSNAIYSHQYYTVQRRHTVISIQWLEGFECAADRISFEALGEASTVSVRFVELALPISCHRPG
jgi:hypothetical protein